jgi:hypothetical protein
MLLLRGKIERQKETSYRLSSAQHREILTPIMAILGFFAVLATAAVFTGDGITRFFLTSYKIAIRSFRPS